MKPKPFYIEIDLSKYDISKDDSCMWQGADLLVSEGEDLQDLLHNAEVYWSNRHGLIASKTSFDDKRIATSVNRMLEQLLINHYFRQLAERSMSK